MTSKRKLLFIVAMHFTQILGASDTDKENFPEYTSGQLVIKRYNTGVLDVVLEGSYQFATWGDRYYEFHSQQPTTVINQGIMAVSDGYSTYQAATVTPKIKTGDKTRDSSRSFARFERGPMPNAGIPSWGPTQGFILAHHLLKMKKNGVLPSALPEEFLPEVIATRGLELRAKSVKGEVINQLNSIEVVFNGRVRESGTTSDIDYTIGRLTIRQFSDVLPLSITLALYIPTNSFADVNLLAEAEMTGAISNTPLFTPLERVTKDEAESVFVRDNRFPECRGLRYTLTKMTAIPFDVSEAHPRSPLNAARQACDQVQRIRSTLKVKRTLLFSLYVSVVLVSSTVYIKRKRNIINT